MALNALKCILVPLSKPFTDGLIIELRDWLKTHAPQLQNMQIKPSAEYLGVVLGPMAHLTRHNKLFAKWKGRSAQTAMANTSSIVSTHAYNVYVASTLSFLAQVTVLPRYFLKAEPAIAASLLKMPYHAIPQNALSSLKHVGLTNLESVEAMNWSALTRAANIT